MSENEFRCNIFHVGSASRIVCNAPDCRGRIVNGELDCATARYSSAMLSLSEPECRQMIDESAAPMNRYRENRILALMLFAAVVTAGYWAWEKMGW